MGCFMGHGAGVRKDFQERGYSTQRFVSENLVPVDCFACTLPPGQDAQGPRMLARELADFSEASKDFYAAQASGAKRGRKKPEVPAKAFCLFRLLSIDLDRAGDGTLDLDNGHSKLGIRLLGGILVPSSAEWLSHPTGSVADALRPAPPRHGEETPMMLAVEVWGLIHRPQTSVQRFGAELESGIMVQAMRAVFKTVGPNGDPMVQSWFPIDDFLTCLTMVLTEKFKFAMEDGMQAGFSERG